MKFVSRCFLLGIVLAAGGCRPSTPEDLAREAVKREAEAAKNAAKSTLEQFGDIRQHNGTLEGADSSGHRLWSVGARELHVRDEKTDAKGVVTPRNADLVDARATLYRGGVPESTVRAKKIHVVYAPQGAYLDLAENVDMTTSGALMKDKPIAGGPVVLHAPSMHIDLKTHRMRADQGAQMKQRETVVTAHKVAADTALGVVQMMGGVKAVAPEGNMEAKQATWDWHKGRAQATGSIVLNRPGSRITGSRLDADTNIAHGVLSGGVRAVAGEGIASAQQVAYDWKAGTLSASGNVRLAKDGATVNAAQLDTDDKLNGAVATGGVTLLKDGITVRAPRVQAFDKMARAVASGGVVLTQAGDTVRAATATVWVNEKRAMASGDVIVEHDGVTLRSARVQAVNLGDRQRMRVEAAGDVRAKGEQGSVRASQVSWGGGRVVATGNVVLQQGANILRGSRLDSDDHFREATLTGKIGGSMADAGGVSAGILLWKAGSGSNGRILGRGGVRARRDNLSLRADNLDLAVNSNGNSTHATLTGNVVVTSDDGTTVHAPRVRYDKAAGKVWATGGVLFEDPKRGLKQKGKTLVADLNLKKATLTEISGSGNMDILAGKKLF